MFFVASNAGQAAWIEIDDFEDGFVLGADINGVNGWSVAAHRTTGDPVPGRTVIDDGTGNQVLQIFDVQNEGHPQKDLPVVIPESSTAATFHWKAFVAVDRLQATGNNIPDFSVRLIGDDGAGGTAPGVDVVSEMNESGNELEAAGASNSNLGAMSAGFWYDFWAVIDSSSETYKLYALGGPEYPTQTLIGIDAVERPEGDIPFRNSVTDLLVAGIRLNTGHNAEHVWIDDLFIDPTGRNLSVPVPEPTSVGLALVALTLFGAVRCRR